MAGTGDQMIRQAEEAAKAATKAREEAGRAQASPGHSTRYSNAQKDEAKAQQALADTRRQWRR